MNEDTQDLYYLADVLCKISRTQQAVEYIDKLISLKPCLTQPEFELFGFVYKSAIDPIRHTLQSLMSFYDTEVDQGHALRAEMIQIKKEEAHRELTKVCHHVIDLINDTLLPAATELRPKIFFYKTVADYYRYLAEFESEDEAKKAISCSLQAYTMAYELCQSKLISCDPMRLGVILNFAIFKFEHLKSLQEANEMLQKARKDAELDLGQLSQNSQNEALEILQAMRTNLVVWFDDEEKE